MTTPTHIWLTTEDHDRFAKELDAPFIERVNGLEVVRPGHHLWSAFQHQVRPGTALVVEWPEQEIRRRVTETLQ